MNTEENKTLKLELLLHNSHYYYSLEELSEEETSRYETLSEELRELQNSMVMEVLKGEERNIEFINNADARSRDLRNQIFEIEKDAFIRYRDSFKDRLSDAEELLKDLINDITKEDFEEHLKSSEEYLKMMQSMEKRQLIQEVDKIFYKEAEYSDENIRKFILREVSEISLILEYFNSKIDIQKLIREKITSLYPAGDPASLPGEHKQGNTYIHNELFKSSKPLSEKTKRQELTVSGKKGKKKVKANVKFQLSKQEGNQQQLTFWDACVFDNIVNFCNWNDTDRFTINQIARFMVSGNSGKKSGISDNLKKEIVESIERMAVIRHWFEVGEHLQMLDLPKDKELLATWTYLLPIAGEAYIQSGNLVFGYRLIDFPLLAIYNEKVEQIESHSADLLDIEGFNMTPQRICIRDKLLKEIGIRLNKKNRSINNSILIDTVLTESLANFEGYENLDNRQKKSYIDFTEACLDTFFKKHPKIKKIYILSKGGDSRYSIIVNPSKNAEEEIKKKDNIDRKWS